MKKRFSDVHPNLSNGTVSGTASFQIENTTGTEQEVAFALNPGYKVNSVQANGQPVPFQIDDYQESNMALLNVTIPALESIDLCFDYHGFPQDWNLMETMQGNRRSAQSTLCLENQALAPAIMNAGTADGTLSSITDITLPDTMTVIPFGLAEAKKEAEHDNGTLHGESKIQKTVVFSMQETMSARILKLWVQQFSSIMVVSTSRSWKKPMPQKQSKQLWNTAPLIMECPSSSLSTL